MFDKPEQITAALREIREQQNRITAAVQSLAGTVGKNTAMINALKKDKANTENMDLFRPSRSSNFRSSEEWPPAVGARWKLMNHRSKRAHAIRGGQYQSILEVVSVDLEMKEVRVRHAKDSPSRKGKSFRKGTWVMSWSTMVGGYRPEKWFNGR